MHRTTPSLESATSKDSAHRLLTTATRSTSPLQTSFLLPNLHCPTCISHITTLMNELQPTPTIHNISLIDHVVTINHASSLKAATIGDLLASSGFEVFDIVLDPASEEILAGSPERTSFHLDDAVRKWNPREPLVAEPARTKHDFHCQTCAAHRASKEGAFEAVTVEGLNDGKPRWKAVLSIEGMTCSSCVGNVTHALENANGVDRAEVALMNHSAAVTFTATDGEAFSRQLVDVVEDSGYGAILLEIVSLEAPHEQEKKIDNHLWEAVYAIEGMTCSSCVSAITQSMRAKDCVRRVDVTLPSHSATVIFSGRANEHSILAAIEDSGYDASLVEIKSLQFTQTSSKRNVRLQVNGMHCPQCPQRIVNALNVLDLQITQDPSLQKPVIAVSYIPDNPRLTIRTIIDTIQAVEDGFVVTVHKSLSLEERSRQMLARERWAIFLRALLALITAIPTLIIGIVYMNLVSHNDPGRQHLMQPIHGVSKAEWATFIMATPVYLFAADYFHRRTVKEVWALWRPKSSVPLFRRLYRLGSMNMLISLGTTIAYFASLAELIIAASNPRTGEDDMMNSAKHSYFDSVVFLTLFLLCGRLAEAHMKAKSGDAVSALGKLRPSEANLVLEDNQGNGTVQTVNMDLIETGDVVRVPHGSSPPCDGTLLSQTAKFDESSLTGESRVIEKALGDTVYSGTINRGSAIDSQVTGPAGMSMLDSIIQVVREGQAKRAPMERIADLLTAYFVPAVVVIAITTWIVWLTLGLRGFLPILYMDNKVGGWPFWSLQFAIAVFVTACPCGLGLAAPTALFVGSGMAAKRGILVKGGGEAFQEASNLDVVVFDKTGTLTKGAELVIVEHEFFQGESQLDIDATLDTDTSDQDDHVRTILGLLRAVEENSSHPLAKAAVQFCLDLGVSSTPIISTEEIPGKGLRAVVGGSNFDADKCNMLVGNVALMQDYNVVLPAGLETTLHAWQSSGYSVLLLANLIADTWEVNAAFAASDPIRPEAAGVIKALQKMDVEVYMLSGDNGRTAQAVGAKVGLTSENIIAGVLPAQKAEKIKYLQQSVLPRRRVGLPRLLNGKRRRATVAMVGDGINDAPALTQADVGIAIASGSHVAIQSASFVLIKSDLKAILTLVSLSRAVFRRVVLNFFWAGVYNVVALPVAAGVLFPIETKGGGHVRLDPVWAALAMALSSLSVVGSSLLLRTGWWGVGFRDWHERGGK